jgi:hypothetical protein
VWKPHFTCKITFFVWKSYSAFRIQSCACLNHTRACFNHIRVCRNHTACRNYTLHVELTLCVYKPHSSVSYSHAYVSNLLDCVRKPHSALKSHRVCGRHNLRVEINLVRFEITLVDVVIPFRPVEITLRVQITLCV